MNIIESRNVAPNYGTLHPIAQPKQQRAFLNTNNVDTVSINKTQAPSFSFKSGKNYIHLVSFRGLNDPTKYTEPAIQMKVTGVTGHQHNYGEKDEGMEIGINKLADSNWRDGEELDFKFEKGKNSKITLSHPEFGEIGRVPDEIAPSIYQVLKKTPNDFKFELSNVIAGTSKGAATTGLRVNLLCTSKSKKVSTEARDAFNRALNDPKAAQKILLYQPKTTPSEVLSTILSQETKDNGVQSAKHMEQAIAAIVKEIDNPENKNILLVSHCKPDGDTLGCALGLKNAIDLVHPDKHVECAVDDDITGLFRHKLPGIDNTFKHPYSQAKIDTLKSNLEQEKETGNNPKRIKEMETDLCKLTDPKTHLDTNKKYDLVVLLDVPAPARFTPNFKNYIENANKTIYIDHHPFRKEEWDASKDQTGVDMDKIEKNHLAWIAERVPAATQMVAILGTKLAPDKNPLNNDSARQIRKNLTPEQQDKVNGYAAALVTGMSTDTGGFTRTANLVPDDIKDRDGNRKPIQWRPNFKPEGLSKWLLSLTGEKISKKWLRDEITYELDDTKVEGFPQTAREKMLEKSEEGKLEDKTLGLGIVQVSYEDMKDIQEFAQINKPETNLLDVQNEFKYSEVMGELRESDSLKPKDSKNSKTDATPPGPYDEKKIAVLICKPQKAGELDHEGQLMKNDALRFSFRSQEGSIHAELLASLFGGGGHGSASGGHLNMDKVDLDTKLAVSINNKKETNNRVIYDELKKNYDIVHDRDLSPEQKMTKCSKVTVVKDDSETGRTAAGIIKDMVIQIRMDDPPF